MIKVRLNWKQKPLNIRTMVYLKKSNGLVILLLTAIFTFFSCSDDDSAPEEEMQSGALLRANLSVEPATIIEGESSVITLTLDAPNDTGASLIFDFSFGGTADPLSDLLSLASTQLIVANGDTETSLMVDSIDDTEAEVDETFTLDISGFPSGAVAGTTTNITLTITDND